MSLKPSKLFFLGFCHVLYVTLVHSFKFLNSESGNILEFINSSDDGHLDTYLCIYAKILSMFGLIYTNTLPKEFYKLCFCC